MLNFLQTYWSYIAFALTVAVIPFGKWVIGQVRKGLASHDDLLTAKTEAADRIAAQAKAAAESHAALERRVNERLDVVSAWTGEHNVLHAKLDGQIAQMRQTMEALPTAGQINQVLLVMKELQGEFRQGLVKNEGQLQTLEANIANVQRSIEQLDGRVSRHEGIFADAARRVPA